ncbi:Polysaccharide transporter, PST family [Rheinheimera salexigens]
MDNIIARSRTAFRWTLTFRVMSQIFTWFASLFVIRLLTPADYGIIAIVETVSMLTLQLASAGLGNALIRQDNLSTTFIRKILGLLIVFNLTLATLQFALAQQIALFYAQPELEIVLKVMTVGFLLSPWVIVASNLLAKEMNFKSRSKIDFIASVCGSISALAMAYLGMGYWSLILANLAVLFFRFIGYNIELKKIYWPSINFSGTSDAIKFGATLAATGILFTVFMKVDILIAGQFLEQNQLGIYAVALHIALLPMAKAMPLINEVAYPMYAAIRKDEKEYVRIFCYIFRITTIYSFPLFYGIAAVAEDAVMLILGDKWLAAVLPLQLILLTIPLRLVTNLFTPLMKALGYPSTGLIHVCFSIIVTVIIIYLSAPYGINAIAASWLISTPFFFLFALMLCTKRSKIPFKKLVVALSPPLLASFIMLAAITAFNGYFDDALPHWLNLIITVIMGALIYIMIMWLGFRNRFKEAIQFRI